MRFYALFSIFMTYMLYSSNGFQDYRIVDKNGLKTDLYERLYYNIKSKMSGYYLSGILNLTNVIDGRDEKLWFTFTKADQDRTYSMHNAAGLFIVNIQFDLISGMEFNILWQTCVDKKYCYIHQADDPKPKSKIIFRCPLSWTCDTSKDYFRWILEESPLYSLNADLVKTNYQIPTKNQTASTVRKVHLMTHTLYNDYPIKMTYKLKKIEKIIFEQRLTLQYKIRLLTKIFAHFNIKVSAEGEAKFFGSGGKSGVETDSKFGVEFETEISISTEDTVMKTEERTFELNQDIIILPNDHVHVAYSVDIMEIDTEFQGELKIHGTGPMVKGNNRLDTDTLKVLLTRSGYEGKLYRNDGYSLKSFINCKIKGSTWMKTTLNISSLKYPTNPICITTPLHKNPV